MQQAKDLPANPPQTRRPTFSASNLYGYLFVLPILLWLGATILYPLVSAVMLSFQDVGIIGTGGEFVGLENYADVLTSDRFWEAGGRSLVWVFGNAIVQTLLAFITALALKQVFPGQKIARTWIILSWIVPTVVVVVIWRWLLNASGGIINYALVGLGFIESEIGFFSSGNSAVTSVILINSWRWFPFLAVIILAGLQSISDDLYDAAAVDGASTVQQFWHITLPGLQPVLFVLGLVGTLLSFNVFDIIWLLTGGGPSSATTTLPVYIYETAFRKHSLSEAAAMSVVVSLFLLAFAVVFIRYAAPRLEED
ncbi:MAG: sugar ABC transporter permease [Chloroflexota bacterium]